MENFYGCPYDFIEIFDGPQSESFSLGRFCSGATPIFTSSSNRLTVVFHSDAIVTNIGFYASYESLVQDENGTGRPKASQPLPQARPGRAPARNFPGYLAYPQDAPAESS